MKSKLIITGTSFLILLLFSCGGKKKMNTDCPTCKKDSAVAKTKEVKVDTISILGYYVGDFEAVEYDAKKKPSFRNKINISIDSINLTALYGHSITAGNLVGFIGNVNLSDTVFKITDAKEQGKNKYNGVFNFDLNIRKRKLTGTWTSNDKKMAVTKCEYKLDKKEFKYDPERNIDQIAGFSLEGAPDYGENNSAEFLTMDCAKFNASTTILKENDIAKMYKGDLEVMRNAIYARHGYSFQNRKMRYLFDYVDWYIPVSIDVRSELTDIEKKNIDLLKRYEEYADKYYDSFGR